MSSASTIPMYGSTSSQARTNSAAVSGSPSIAIRSRTVVRCGEVNRPVRVPSSRSSASIIRAVEVLPFVPVRWTAR
ncbi:hypothetical protein [Salana multivorans]